MRDTKEAITSPVHLSPPDVKTAVGDKRDILFTEPGGCIDDLPVSCSKDGNVSMRIAPGRKLLNEALNLASLRRIICIPLDHFHLNIPRVALFRLRFLNVVLQSALFGCQPVIIVQRCPLLEHLFVEFKDSKSTPVIGVQLERVWCPAEGKGFFDSHPFMMV